MEEKKSFTPEIYKELISAVEALPKSAVIQTKAAATKKGYDTTGFQYQYLVNVLNEVVGVSGWNFDYQIVKESEGSFASGQKWWEVTVNMQVNILDAWRKSAGGHKSALHNDALKGAVTSALKKTLGLFGIGKSAYEGTLDEDYLNMPEGKPSKIKIPDEKTAQKAEQTAGTLPDGFITAVKAREAKKDSVVSIRAELIIIAEREANGSDVTDYILCDSDDPKAPTFAVAVWGKPDPKLKEGMVVDAKEVKIHSVGKGSGKIITQVKK